MHRLPLCLSRAVARVGDTGMEKTAITFGKCLQEWNVCQRIGRIRIEGEVGDELVFRAYLKVVSGLCLPIVHSILLHPHECGIRVGL
jgi:hypothetical protein